MKTGEGVCNLW